MKKLLAILFLSTAVTAAFAKKNSSKSHARSHATTTTPRDSAPTVSKLDKFLTVVVDAGHGGFDPGGIEQNIIPEKGVALDVALRLSVKLREEGLNTVLTREDDTFIPLDRRVAIADEQTHAIFVSIHFNSGLRLEARGTESYYSSPICAPLAQRIQRNIAITNGGDNRGSKWANFYVLRKTKIPAVLIECGFLTNTEDAALAQDETYRQKIAEQIAAAIMEFRATLP